MSTGNRLWTLFAPQSKRERQRGQRWHLRCPLRLTRAVTGAYYRGARRPMTVAAFICIPAPPSTINRILSFHPHFAYFPAHDRTPRLHLLPPGFSQHYILLPLAPFLVAGSSFASFHLLFRRFPCPSVQSLSLIFAGKMMSMTEVSCSIAPMSPATFAYCDGVFGFFGGLHCGQSFWLVTWSAAQFW